MPAIDFDIPGWFVPLVLVLFGIAATFPFAVLGLVVQWRKRGSRGFRVCAWWAGVSGLVFVALGALMMFEG